MSISESRLPAGLPPRAPSKPQPSLVLSAQLAALAVTGLIVWRAALSTRLVHPTLAGAAGQACGIALLGLLCSGAIMIALQLLSGGSLGFETLRISLRTARTAVWLAPIAVLFYLLPAAALAAALVFAIATTQLLYSRGPEPEIGIRSNSWLRFSANAVALGAQTTLVAALAGTRLLAGALLCFSAAGLVLLCLVTGTYRRHPPASLPKSLGQTLLTLVLAIGLMIGGRMIRFGSGSSANAEPDPKARASPREVLTTLYIPPRRARGGAVTDKSFPGVILWPETKEAQKELTAPRPWSWLTTLTPVPRTPFSIPFTGQYWMFKPPQEAPPPGSYFRRDSPLARSFSTTDQRPMAMEALQKLDHALDLSCCRAIRIDISNADRYPGTIALELLLMDTQSLGQPSESLGRRDVLSTPSVLPVTEVLEFPVPGTGIRKFDVMQVVFHRGFFRVDRSAKISIESFTLVPP
jgi:hypothetical protein